MDLPFEDMAKASSICFNDTCCMSIVLTINETAATGGKGQNLYKFPHEADCITNLRNGYGYDYDLEQTVKEYADEKSAMN